MSHHWKWPVSNHQRSNFCINEQNSTLQEHVFWQGEAFCCTQAPNQLLSKHASRWCLRNVYKFFLKVVLQLHLPFWDNQQWQGAHQFASLAPLKPLDVLLFAFLTLISLLIWATVDWLIPSESATFFCRITTPKLHQCFVLQWFTQPRHRDTFDKWTFTADSAQQEQHNKQKMPWNLATRSAQWNFNIQQEQAIKIEYARLCAFTTLFS